MSKRASPRRSPAPPAQQSSTVVVRIVLKGQKPMNFTVPESDPLENVLREFCTKSELAWGSVSFTDSQNRVIESTSTPAALGFTGRVILTAAPVVTEETVISPVITGSPAASPKSRKTVTLKVTSPTGEVATKRISVDTPFKVAFEQLTKKWDLVGKPIKFFLNGKKLLNPESTPSTHNIAGTAELVARERAGPAPKEKSPSKKSSKTSTPVPEPQPEESAEEPEHQSFWSRCEVC